MPTKVARAAGATALPTLSLNPDLPPSQINDDDPLIDSDELDTIQPGSRTAKKRWRKHLDPELRMPAPIKFSPGGRAYWRLSWITDWQRRVAEHYQNRSGAQGDGG